MEGLFKEHFAQRWRTHEYIRERIGRGKREGGKEGIRSENEEQKIGNRVRV